MTFNIPKNKNFIPSITTAQMIEVDRLMVEKYQIYLLQMMENAGRALAILAKNVIGRVIDENVSIAVFAGSGGNGGGALVAARRLTAWGANVSVYLSKPKSAFKGVPLIQLNSLEKMGTRILLENEWNPNEEYNLILDGIIGYSLNGAPRGSSKTLIEFINGHPAQVLSLDVPSGMDSTSGVSAGVFVQADYTLTLALPKTGFNAVGAEQKTGRLFLADISVPPSLYKNDVGIAIGNLFVQGDIIEITNI